MVGLVVPSARRTIGAIPIRRAGGGSSRVHTQLPLHRTQDAGVVENLGYTRKATNEEPASHLGKCPEAHNTDEIDRVVGIVDQLHRIA
jgi:hypothetical protein